MKKVAFLGLPVAVLLFFPLLAVIAVAGVGGISQAVDCAGAGSGSVVSGGEAGSFGIGTLNWRGASHYTRDPHRGEQPYNKRVPHMAEKINDSVTTIIGFQEFEPPQAQAFLTATRGQWDIVRGRAHGRPDTRDAIAYQPSAWTVAETRYVSINYGGNRIQIPMVRFSSTTGVGDVWVLNTHNPANVVNGSNAMRDAAVRAEAQALRAQQLSDPITPQFLTGDMNDRSRFKRLFLAEAAAGWSAANPDSNQIDWIMGNSRVGFANTVVDRSTNDGAHDYTDHPFVHTTATVAATEDTDDAAADSADDHAGDPIPDTGDGPGVLPAADSGEGDGPITSTDSIAGSSTVPSTVSSTSTVTGRFAAAEVAAAAAYQAGFRGEDLYTMVWIAGGESSYDTHAINHYSQGGQTYYVYGLWQISSIHPGVSAPAIYDPLTNATRAFALYRGRGGSPLGDGGSPSRFDDWSAHTSANETRYGTIARQAIAAALTGQDGATGTPVPAVMADCQTGSVLPTGMEGSGDFTANGSVAYVGPYSPGELVARMQKIMALNGTGANLDPFFGTEPDGSWYHDCQHFVANLDGRPNSGYSTAAAAWSHFQATGAAHPVGSPDGMSPPAGAWLYYGNNHVVVYLGNNLVAGTDTWGAGTAKIGPAADVQKWLASQGGYRGWVVPWGAPVNSSLAA